MEISPLADGLELKEGVERPSRVAAWFLTLARGLRALPRRLRNVGIHSARSGLSRSRLGIAARPLKLDPDLRRGDDEEGKKVIVIPANAGIQLPFVRRDGREFSF